VQRDPASKRYARAAFEIARDRDELDTWERDIRSLAAALASDQAQAFVSTARVPRQDKESFMQRAAGQVSPLAWNLVRLLNQKGRLALLPQIGEVFQELVDEHRGVAHAQVLTAVPLSDEERQAMTRRLSELTGKQVTLHAHEAPEILGGLIARIGDELLDGSTKTKLEALKRQLAGTR
jgi:F-type H+-transporting ATPase subunit delta